MIYKHCIRFANISPGACTVIELHFHPNPKTFQEITKYHLKNKYTNYSIFRDRFQIQTLHTRFVCFLFK